MKKILIVDDEPVMLQVMRRILSEHYAIVCSSSGEEALELFDQERPDMVLSDLRMPGMDGYELRCRLREKSDIPFIFMTSDDSEESERRGFDIGAADYIRKPANAAILLRRIGNIVQNIEKISGLKEAASLDAMTQLLNKGAARQAVGELCQREPGVLLLIDLDSFKLVNDIYGHAMGDRILIRFSELLRDIVGSAGLAGRLGGDEFLAYLQNVTEESAIRERAEYLNEQLLRSAREYMGEDMGIPLGVSVGAVFAPAEGRDFSELCQKADAALYDVKNNGKHGIAFYTSGARGTEAAGPTDISRMRRILDERIPEAGALVLDFDRFQCVYRYVSRLGEQHLKRAHLLCFTFPSGLSRETAERFREMLRTTLRRSDCILQNSSSQFFALLTDTEGDSARRMKDRIRETWAGASPSPEYVCDLECMGNIS